MSDEKRLVYSVIPLLSAKDKETTMLTLFRFEMRKARLQLNRIDEDMRAMEGLRVNPQVGGNLYDAETGFFADIHFLLVCLKKLDSILYKMQKYFPENPQLIELRNRYGKFLHDCGDLRDDLEHVEDRPGKGVEGLGSTFGLIFQFDDKQLDVGPNLRATVEALFTDVVSAYDAILIRRRKESGESHVWLKGKVKIP